ncbi:MAG: YchF family ATPase [Candidatus Portnoybacteria bacterium]|nr:YchF family ATPase [Candidatus Portnoybacteria bacterium]
MLSIGIVGLPNVGKSSLYKALTKNEVEIANYPFATIEPHRGIVKVPDERLEKLAALEKSKRVIPTIIEFVDIAGLVKDAHKGAGLGNQFLSHIREVDAVLQVVRAFENPDIIRNEGPLSPKDDIELINLELEMGDIKKPTLYALNTNKGESAEEIVKKYTLETLGINANEVIPLSIKDELDMDEFTSDQQRELGIKSHLDELIVKSYALLDLITFFSTGEDETRAWTVKRGSPAPVAGGKIHSDFAEKFIRAEVIPYQKLVEVGGWASAKTKGWVTTRGKDYIVQDGDVIEFKI